MSYFMRQAVREPLWPNQHYVNSVSSKIAEFVAEIGGFHEKQLRCILDLSDEELEPTVLHICEMLLTTGRVGNLYL